jgi:hypothetical protein
VTKIVVFSVFLRAEVYPPQEDASVVKNAETLFTELNNTD